MDTIIQKIWTVLFNFLITTLFQIGGTSISLWSIFEVIFSLGLVFFISRILTNFLKNKLLAKIGIDPGNRETIVIIVRYITVALGIILVLEGIGINLASLAVIAGGLGVGIGFSIQDLTTNFVSGLTILLDRPVKVGDFVELDGLMGIVKEISIRSTIIQTNYDSSVIVPNRDIITNKIVNWSYDDQIYCLQIPVQVADDNDPLLVTETLLNTAYIEAGILEHPHPKVLFVEFGEDSFKFELLVWTDRPADREVIKSSLNFAIEYNFRQQEIKFPYNRRDLWIQNPESLIKLLQNNSASIENIQDHNQHPDEQIPQIAKGIKNQLSVSNMLRTVEYFEHFGDLELRRLIEVGYRQRLSASEILFREGDPGDAFYIVLSGSVEVFVEKINKHLKKLSTGQFFGELALMLGIPRTASVRALEETMLFTINKKGFQKLLSQYPELSEQIIQELAKHQEELTERQQQLRAIGLVDEAEDDQNPVNWVRKRLKNLFSL